MHQWRQRRTACEWPLSPSIGRSGTAFHMAVERLDDPVPRVPAHVSNRAGHATSSRVTFTRNTLSPTSEVPCRRPKNCKPNARATRVVGPRRPPGRRRGATRRSCLPASAFPRRAGGDRGTVGTQRYGITLTHGEPRLLPGLPRVERAGIDVQIARLPRTVAEAAADDGGSRLALDRVLARPLSTSQPVDDGPRARRDHRHRQSAAPFVGAR